MEIFQFGGSVVANGGYAGGKLWRATMHSTGSPQIQEEVGSGSQSQKHSGTSGGSGIVL
jgi:hypothetical protein